MSDKERSENLPDFNTNLEPNRVYESGVRGDLSRIQSALTSFSLNRFRLLRKDRSATNPTATQSSNNIKVSASMDLLDEVTSPNRNRQNDDSDDTDKSSGNNMVSSVSSLATRSAALENSKKSFIAKNPIKRPSRVPAPPNNSNSTNLKADKKIQVTNQLKSIGLEKENMLSRKITANLNKKYSKEASHFINSFFRYSGVSKLLVDAVFTENFAYHIDIGLYMYMCMFITFVLVQLPIGESFFTEGVFFGYILILLLSIFFHQIMVKSQFKNEQYFHTLIDVIDEELQKQRRHEKAYPYGSNFDFDSNANQNIQNNIQNTNQSTKSYLRFDGTSKSSAPGMFVYLSKENMRGVKKSQRLFTTAYMTIKDNSLSFYLCKFTGNKNTSTSELRGSNPQTSPTPQNNTNTPNYNNNFKNRQKVAHVNSFVFYQVYRVGYERAKVSLCDLSPEQPNRYWSKQTPLCVKYSTAGLMKRTLSSSLSMSYELIRRDHAYKLISVNPPSGPLPVPLSKHCVSLDLNLDGGEFYVYALTGREKEYMYRIIRKKYDTISLKNELTIVPALNMLTTNTFSKVRSHDLNFYNVMAHFYMVNRGDMPSSSEQNMMDFMSADNNAIPTLNQMLNSESVFLLNTMVYRVLFDFIRNKNSINEIKNKFQLKLNRLELPSFLKSLTITNMEMGDRIPVFCCNTAPTVDKDGGIWSFLPMVYSDKFTVTIDAHMSVDLYDRFITYMGKKIETENDEKKQSRSSEKSPVGLEEDEYEEEEEYELDMEGLNEVMLEEMEIEEEEENEEEGSKTSEFNDLMTSNIGKKFVNTVEKLAKSSFVKKMAKTGIAKKIYSAAKNKLTNTHIILTVEVTQMKGTIAVYIPPPASDRVWVGFKTPPAMQITAKPQVNTKVVKIPLLSQFITTKLRSELNDALVLPNMEDVRIPLMKGLE